MVKGDSDAIYVKQAERTIPRKLGHTRLQKDVTK